MAVSYSFHLSNRSNAVSTIQKVAQVSRHNLRAYKSDTYDKNQIEILRGSSKSILDDVKKIYHEEFDSLIEEYNEGKRADRQIGDYLKKISDSRGDVACEIIIQIGDKEFWKDKSLSDKKRMNYIFSDQVKYLEHLVPELKIASAVVHFDESSPHMHIIGVPVASGYKNGMERQVAKTKVFTAERLSELQNKMRARAEVGMRLNKHIFDGEEVKEKEEGRRFWIPKYAIDDYYEVLDKTTEAKSQLKALKKELDKAQNEITSLSAIKTEKEAQIADLSLQIEKSEEELGKLQHFVKTISDKLDKLLEKIAKAFHLPERIYDRSEVLHSMAAVENELDELNLEIQSRPKRNRGRAR